LDELPAAIHALNLSIATDIIERVPLQDNKTSKLAYLQGAQVGKPTQDACVVARRQHDRF
jgi:hypothetical protein